MTSSISVTLAMVIGVVAVFVSARENRNLFLSWLGQTSKARPKTSFVAAKTPVWTSKRATEPAHNDVFDIDMPMPELERRYEQLIALAARHHQSGNSSGVTRRDYNQALDQAILCRSQIDLVRGGAPSGQSVDDYRDIVFADIISAAEGRS